MADTHELRHTYIFNRPDGMALLAEVEIEYQIKESAGQTYLESASVGVVCVGLVCPHCYALHHQRTWADLVALGYAADVEEWMTRRVKSDWYKDYGFRALLEAGAGLTPGLGVSDSSWHED